MKLADVQRQVAGVPFITPEWGRILYDFIIRTRPEECLELGFAHGVSSCYIAAALDELGRGHLTSVDLQSSAKWQHPSIEDLLSKTGLEKHVTVVRERTSYTWYLKKKIEERTAANNCEPVYDFCYIDGAKNWTVDGCAFFLVDKLLKEDAWILFDDYKWYYRKEQQDQSEALGTGRGAGEDELTEAHVERIFRLLVMQHPHYGEFFVENDKWAWAHKVSSPAKTVTFTESRSMRSLVMRAVRRLAHRGE